MNTGTPKEIKRSKETIGPIVYTKNIHVVSKFNILNCCYYYKGKIQGQLGGYMIYGNLNREGTESL